MAFDATLADALCFWGCCPAMVLMTVGWLYLTLTAKGPGTLDIDWTRKE